MGLTLDELADVARTKTERRVTVLRDLTAEQFQEHMKRANDPGVRYVVNFDRKGVFGAGAGHHSPIGGYLEVEDLVFVLDVNRDYQPWLVQRDRLFRAMDTRDGKKKRGLLLIESTTPENWRGLWRRGNIEKSPAVHGVKDQRPFLVQRGRDDVRQRLALYVDTTCVFSSLRCNGWLLR